MCSVDGKTCVKQNNNGAGHISEVKVPSLLSKDGAIAHETHSTPAPGVVVAVAAVVGVGAVAVVAATRGYGQKIQNDVSTAPSATVASL